MNNYEFLEELSEARIFKRLDLLKGSKADDIAIMMLNMILALIIIWHEDQDKAKRYTQIMMTEPYFLGFKTTQTDLYNALVLLLRQEKYSDKIVPNYNISLPELRIKRVIRYLSQGRYDKDEMYQLLTIIYRNIKGITGEHNRMRRQFAFYENLSIEDKIRNLRWLMLQFRAGKARYSDIYPMLDIIWKRIT